MQIIKYRSSADGKNLCMCPNCRTSDPAYPTRLANVNAFVRIEVRLKELVLLLSTSLNMYNDQTLFIHFKPGCYIYKMFDCMDWVDCANH